MSTKKVIASYVVELLEDESGFQSITATQQEPSGDFSVRRVIATSWGISATIQLLSKELCRTYNNHLLFRC